MKEGVVSQVAQRSPLSKESLNRVVDIAHLSCNAAYVVWRCAKVRFLSRSIFLKLGKEATDLRFVSDCMDDVAQCCVE